MYDVILVPLDGSARAERALAHAEGLALALKSRIAVIRVVETPSDTSLELADLRRQAGEAEEYLESIRRLLHNRGVDVITRMAYGDVVVAIIDAARDLDVGLVVMTSHGRRGVKRVFYGSIAAGILQRIDRPLLVIRARGERWSTAWAHLMPGQQGRQ